MLKVFLAHLQTDSLISLAFVKGLAVGVSLAKDTLGGSCRNGACLDHPIVKFFGVFSRPAMWFCIHLVA
jgi:hypothetical protein